MSYDIVIVGSGNGACGFLSEYQQNISEKSKEKKILVLEEGDNFFETSDITHQKNWTKSYTEENIYKLHSTFTPQNIPIITGRACTMGGGGSINYALIHESSKWLAKNIGQSEKYWDQLKQELNIKFLRPDPVKNQSPVTQYLLKKAQDVGFRIAQNSINHIPSHEEGDEKLLHRFATQFDPFGQRTHSGVSLVDWTDPRIDIKVRCKVLKLEFSQEPQDSENQCSGVHVEDLRTGKQQFFPLSEQGKLILCAGAATPRLLLPYKEMLNNEEIGKHVGDHIAIPLGIYTLDQQTIDVTTRDNYIPVFATTLWKPQEQGEKTVCTFDFFSGDFPQLIFFFSQLYFAYIAPNWLKRLLPKAPRLFFITKNAIRILMQIINFLINIWWSISDVLKGKSWGHEDLPLITGLVKFNPGAEGYYSNDASQIILGFFEDSETSKFNQDKAVAKSIITENLSLFNSLGKQPPWILKQFFRLVTKIPYDPQQVDAYIEQYSQKFLSAEQHMSGGCIFGKVVDQGIENPHATGKVKGTKNIHVADLSTVPLPRVSTQMTAYLIGFYIAKMLFSDEKNLENLVEIEQENSHLEHVF